MSEPLYGFPSNAPAQEFVKVKGTTDLFYIYDEELDVNKLLAEPLPPPSIAVNVVPHWLAIEGVQPLIPENPSLDHRKEYQQRGRNSTNKEETLMKAKSKPNSAAIAGEQLMNEQIGKETTNNATNEEMMNKEKEGGQKFAPVLQHVLSKELQVYFDRITALLRGGGGKNDEELQLLNAAIGSLRTDAGLANLIPYFAKFISTEVQTNLRNLRKLMAMMRAIGALVQNPAVNLELYLHQLMPSVLTCIVAKRLSENPDKDNHWQLRVLASKTVAEICERYGEEYATLQPRVTATLQKGLKTVQSPLPTIFGALVGLSSLGARVIETLVSPELDRIVQRAEDILNNDRTSDATVTATAEEKSYERSCAEKVLEAAELATDVLHEREIIEKRENAKQTALQTRVGRLLEAHRKQKLIEAQNAVRKPSAGELPPIIKKAVAAADKSQAKAAARAEAAAAEKEEEEEAKEEPETKKRKAKSPTPPPVAATTTGRAKRGAAAQTKKEEEFEEEEVKPPPAKRSRRGGR
jgi:transcription initiation factor TFIID subunit 6